jgi:outer membrane protein OmpA-like peptidoglycan-associated protein
MVSLRAVSEASAMNPNIMDAVRGMLTPEIVGQAADQTGESADGMKKAARAAIPVAFAGLTQAASPPGGAERVFAMVTRTGASGSGLMGTLFGDRSKGVTDVLAKSSGVRTEAASHALSMALPLVIGALGKHVLSNRLDARGLAQSLFGQKKAILDDPSTPPGLASALGMGSLSELGGASAGVGEPHVSVASASVGEPHVSVASPPPAAVERAPILEPQKRSRLASFLPLALLAGLIVIGIVALTRTHAKTTGVTAPQPTVPALPTPTVEAPAAGILLPGGKILDVAPDSAEALMAHALGNPVAPLPRTFHFDNLKFDTASATVSPAGAKTVDDIGAMLQAYPTARVRIDGNADVVGPAAANQTLSKARADSVRDMLVQRGVDAGRIETAGEGSRRPAPGNAAPRQLAPDRRTDVTLLSR